MTTKVPYPLLDQPNLKFTDIASAATVNLDTALGAYGNITGTTTITAITLTEGKVAWVRFAGALTLTHGAALVLPGAANITTAANDWAAFAKVGSAVYCIYYSKATGKAVITSALTADLPAGAVVQQAKVQSGALVTGTTVLPYDDTIPQSGEGIELMTLAFTPKSAASKLKIEVVVYAANSAAGGQMIAALFRDAGADALAAGAVYFAGGGQIKCVKFTHHMDSPGASETTFKVRGGSNSAGTTSFNGAAGARVLGGVVASSITVTEVAG